MQEMGYQSAIGVVLVFTGGTVFIPAFYLGLERILGPEPRAIVQADQENPRGLWFTRLRVPPWVAIGIPVVTFALAACLFLAGKIETKTTPWDYRKGTLVDRTFQLL